MKAIDFTNNLIVSTPDNKHYFHSTDGYTYPIDIETLQKCIADAVVYVDECLEDFNKCRHPEACATDLGGIWELGFVNAFKNVNGYSFRQGKPSSEKDLVCIDNDTWGIEIKSKKRKDNFKTFSATGNRCYPKDKNIKKSKDSFYFVVNYNFTAITDNNPMMKIDNVHVWFGKVDKNDWKYNPDSNGNSANISGKDLGYKFIQLV